MPEAAPELQVCFAAELYSLDAIKRAAYRVSDRVIVEILQSSATITCILRPSPAARGGDTTQLEHDFRLEVLDQDLRARIAAETEPLRNLILSIAFSKTGLQE